MVKLRFLVPLLGMMMLDLGPMEVGYAGPHKTNKGCGKQVKSNVRKGRNSQGSSNARPAVPASTSTASAGSGIPPAPVSASAVSADSGIRTTSTQSMTRAPYASDQSMIVAKDTAAHAFKVITEVFNSARQAIQRAHVSTEVRDNIGSLSEREIGSDEAARGCNKVTEAELVRMKNEFEAITKLFFVIRAYVAVAQNTADPAIATIAATVADRAATVAENVVGVRAHVSRGGYGARHDVRAALAKVVSANIDKDIDVAIRFSNAARDRATAATSIAELIRNAAESAAAAADAVKAAIESINGTAAVTEAVLRTVDDNADAVRNIATVVADLARVVATDAHDAAADADEATSAAYAAAVICDDLRNADDDVEDGVGVEDGRNNNTAATTSASTNLQAWKLARYFNCDK